MVSFTPQTLYPRGWNSLPVSIDLLGLVMDDAGFTSITSLKFFFFSSLGLSTLFFLSSLHMSSSLKGQVSEILTIRASIRVPG